MPRERKHREEPALEAPKYALAEKVVLVIVRHEDLTDTLVVTGDNYESAEIQALRDDVESWEKSLESRLSELEGRKAQVPSRKHKSGQSLSRSERVGIYQNIDREREPLNEKLGRCYDFFSKLNDLEGEMPSPGHTLVVTRKDGAVTDVQYNPQGEADWWKFVTTPKDAWNNSEAWHVYRKNPNLFLVLHDAFIAGFNYKLVKGGKIEKERAAKEQYDRSRNLLGSLSDENFELVGPAWKKAMQVIGL